MSHTVDLAAVDELVTTLATFDARVEARIGDLDAQVRRLHGVWEGEAALAQQQAQRELLAGVEELRQGLSRLRAAAQTAHGNYTTAVATNERLFHGLG